MNFQAAKKGLTHRINSQLYGRPPPGILNFEYSQCEKREIREREFWLIELRNFQLNDDFSQRSNTQGLYALTLLSLIFG